MTQNVAILKAKICTKSFVYRCIASLTIPGWQEFHLLHFPQISLIFSYFSSNFPHFILILALRVAHSGRYWLQHCLYLIVLFDDIYQLVSYITKRTKHLNKQTNKETNKQKENKNITKRTKNLNKQKRGKQKESSIRVFFKLFSERLKSLNFYFFTFP